MVSLDINKHRWSGVGHAGWVIGINWAARCLPSASEKMAKCSKTHWNVSKIVQIDWLRGTTNSLQYFSLSRTVISLNNTNCGCISIIRALLSVNKYHTIFTCVTKISISKPGKLFVNRHFYQSSLKIQSNLF